MENTLSITHRRRRNNTAYDAENGQNDVQEHRAAAHLVSRYPDGEWWYKETDEKQQDFRTDAGHVSTSMSVEKDHE